MARLVARAPLRLAIGLLLGWILVAGLAGGAWSLGSGASITDDAPQLFARLAGSAIVLAILWRAGWLQAAGVGRSGPLRAWIVAAVAVAYLVPGYLLALFGEAGPARLGTALADGFPRLWLIQSSVGFAEELLFRGLLLVVLATAWGRFGRGGLAAAFGTGALFAVPHLLAVIGADPALVTLNALAAMVSGFWYAGLVLAYGSIWPVVLVHAATNLAVLSLPLSADAGGYLRLLLVELPWLAFGVWLVLGPARRRREPGPTAIVTA